MIFQTSRLLKGLVVLLAIASINTSPHIATAAQPLVPCPAGWIHGGRPNLAEDEHICGGQVLLDTHSVDSNRVDEKAIATLTYQAPEDCLSFDATYRVWVHIKHLDYYAEVLTDGHSGSVDIVLGVKQPMAGPYPIDVIISSPNCYAPTEGWFTIVAVNEQLVD
jgi:hypothetical protein